MSYFPFWCLLFRSCVACLVLYVVCLVVVIAVFFGMSPCLYPCRFACTLFSVPLLGVGVWGVGVVLLGLLGFFPGVGVGSVGVCTLWRVPFVGSCVPRLGMVCRGIVLCFGVLFLVCRRFGWYVSWCLRYMMCTVFSVSAFRFSVSVLSLI